VEKHRKLLPFGTESAINETDFRFTPSKNFFAKSFKYCCFLLAIAKKHFLMNEYKHKKTLYVFAPFPNFYNRKHISKYKSQFKEESPQISKIVSL